MLRRLREFCRNRRKGIIIFLVGTVAGGVAVAANLIALHETSTTEFCMSCHEMQVLAEQAWMYSSHYENPSGVVAQCVDCHVPPELVSKLWVKSRDGMKDVAVHYLGESDPEKMDWDALAASARSKISDSACLKCHENLTPKGMEIQGLVAHREYQRMTDSKRCLDCHLEKFHGRIKQFLGINETHDTGEKAK